MGVVVGLGEVLGVVVGLGEVVGVVVGLGEVGGSGFSSDCLFSAFTTKSCNLSFQN